MATRIVLPKQGLQMTEGIIVGWLTKVGDTISRGQALVEIETDKTTMQVEAPVDGVVLAILCAEGDTVPVATTIAVIGAPGEDISSLRQGREAAAVEALAEAGPAAAALPPSAEPHAAPSPDAGETVYATPRARMAASDRHVDLRAIHGTGPDRLIIERDVVTASAALAASAAPTQDRGHAHAAASAAPTRASVPVQAAASSHAARVAPPPEGVLVSLSSMRRIIARRMKESLEASAQAAHEMDIDCTEMVRLRTDLAARKTEVSYTDIVIKALGVALSQHPLMNSTWTEAGILTRSSVNVGVAVALEDGLVVPVVRNADALSLSSIHARTREVIARARSGGLCAEDLEGAGFTVTNLGMFEVDRFTAIIDPPQSGILALGRIVRRPVAIEQAVQIRPLMTITLSYDHRVIDGAPAARFLQTVRHLLESPCLMI